MAISYRFVRQPVRDDIELTSAQAVVAGHRHGALVVLGGPRTGKTTAAIEAAASALREGVPRVLFFTGSRRDRLAVRAGVAARFPHLFSRLTVTTFYSFCQELVEKYTATPVTVLSAARQDSYIRAMVAGQAADAWPDRFAQARGTNQFAVDVREAVAACQRVGLTPADVAARARTAGRDDWAGLARFYREYLDVLGLASVLDYPELLIGAGQLLRRDDVLAGVCPAGSLIVVDDAEEMDPAQAEIVLALAGGSSPAIIAANPDAQVFGFRGARTGSLGTLVQQWSDRGCPTSVVVLETGHDVCQGVEDACRTLRRRIPLPAGLGLTDLDRYRNARADRPGDVVKVVFRDGGTEADQIACLLLAAHRHDHVPYEDMAILVRRKDEFPRYALACQEAGVPVVVSGDEIQLNREDIVTTLLAALRAVKDGPGCRALDRQAVLDSPLSDSENPEARDARCSSVIEAGTAQLGSSAADVLWAVWEASGWQDRLLDQTGRGGEDALAANRALDAVVALFAMAAQFAELSAEAGIRALDEAVAVQELPENLPRSSSWTVPAVRLTTAHRAKGQAWPVVVVAGVEEGVWPARYQPPPVLSLAGLSDRITVLDESENLNAERRLLYAACVSASQRLVITAVTDGDRSPSVFFDQVDAEMTPELVARGDRVWSAPGLVGRLRSVAADESAQPGLRQAACDRLAALSGNPAFRGADPSMWWALGEPADLAGLPDPQREPTDLITLSASQVEALLECPRQWFLAREGRADRPPGLQAQIGSLIHAQLRDPAATLDEMKQALAEAWTELAFPAAWMEAPELDQAMAALDRFDAFSRSGGREVLASEAGVDVTVTAAGPVRLRGRVDRLERDADGRVWIVDFKTGRHAPTRVAAAANPQLGLYQLALLSGGLRSVTGTEPVIGGAELVFLRLPAGPGSALPKVLRQVALSAVPYLAAEPRLPLMETALARRIGGQEQYPTWVHHRMALAAAVVRQSDYPAIAGSGCRQCSFARGCPVIDRQRMAA